MALRHILFSLDLFPDESERANSQKRVLALLEALTLCNQFYLQEHPETPLLYQSGVKYSLPAQFEKEKLPAVQAVEDFVKSRGAGQNVLDAMQAISEMCGAGENFREIPRIIENGGGDCDNLASWRAAELRHHGIQARPYITWRKRPDGGMTYHVIVLMPDGSSEDPSLLLGMGGAARAKGRAEEERKLGERTADVLKGDFSSTFGTGRSETVFGKFTPPVSGDPGFGKGLQYTIPFQTDDSYEAWSPTRPAAFYADPRYAGGLVQNTPQFNTRWRDADELDGDLSPSQRRRLVRALKRP